MLISLLEPISMSRKLKKQRGGNMGGKLGWRKVTKGPCHAWCKLFLSFSMGSMANLSVHDKKTLDLMYSPWWSIYYLIGLNPWVRGSSKPSGLAAAAIITQFYVELQPKSRNSGITHHTDFPCRYPENFISLRVERHPMTMTSIANFWWIWLSKTSRFLFSFL